MATVLITGGTGLIGQALTKELTAKGYEVIILTRRINPSKEKPQPLVSYAVWNIEQQTIDKKAVQKADYIIHLAGANVAGGRWTQNRKRLIRESRTKSAALLVKALKEIPNKVKAVVSASAIGWYGMDPQVPNPKPFVETDPSDASFLGQTCKLWESSIEPVMDLGKRLVKLRTGIVLSNKDGAYAEFKKPLRIGIAPVLGNGKQILSWIHINDIAGLYLYAIENEKMQGVYNAVAPQPVTNRQLILAMAKAGNKFYITVPVPEIALKTGLGEMSIEVLKSATVSNKKAEKAGYLFMFPSIEAAVHNLEAL
jgi:uncharacterized protein (TIGR01777 family)